MTFETTAWAIDGAQLTSSLARRAEYAATVGAQGIVSRDDLKVTQLSTPGVGVQIAPGVAILNNKYQSMINESYVVSNPTVHIIPSGSMPASSASARSFIVAVTIGDPDFSQAGHPWMTSSDPAPGTELTFNYVRVILVEVPAGTVALSGAYPNYPLARIDIPASTTTITNAMITDLRALARPRNKPMTLVSPAGLWNTTNHILTSSSYVDWGNSFAPTVEIPSWAVAADLSTFINSVSITDSSVSINGGILNKIGSISGTGIVYDTPTASGGTRQSYMVSNTFDVSTLAGTTAPIKIQGARFTGSGTGQALRLASGSQIIHMLTFREA